MADDTEILSLEEVGRLLGRLRHADLLRLAAMAKARTMGMPRRDPSDLLNEALARVLSGERPWPVHLGLLPFLSQVMRSIAHQWRHEDRREPLTEETAEVLESEAAGSNHEIADLISRMRTVIADDPVAAGIFEHTLLQTGRKQICDVLGIDATEFDTARRRMIRTLHRQFHPGWKDD